MQVTGLQMAAYLAAAILFVKSLGGLSNQETARQGNWFGIAGMVLAVGATLMSPKLMNAGAAAFIPLIIAFAIAGVIGIVFALKVEMTQMPQLVALLHSFVGLAAVLVGFGSYLQVPATPVVVANIGGAEHVIHLIEIFIGVFVGAVTFTGSLVAFGKLQGTISGKALDYTGRHAINLALIIITIVLGVFFVKTQSMGIAISLLIVMTLIACFIGVILVMAIGGADMPVVVSMLNSYSGWAAAAAGFMLENDLLIVVGALVGSSGAILSYIMCKAMNRSFLSVIFGGFSKKATKKDAVEGEDGPIQEMNATDVADLLKNSRSVVIAPGYGMAVAKAQYPVFEMMKKLQAQGIDVKFAIHPVAGRLPGHMNVLLAEARVPYDVVLEMDEINPDLPQTDVVLVIGANDIVNPAAEEDEDSSIYGMPVIQAWNAGKVIIMKRSMAPGYAGIQNPLFFKENSHMLFGDAKAMVDELVTLL